MPGRKRSHRSASGLGHLDQDAAPVLRVGEPTDQPLPLQPVEGAGHGRRGDQGAVADLARGERLAGTFDDGKGVGDLQVDLHRRRLHDPVDLADQRRAGPDQGRVDLGRDGSLSGNSSVKSSPPGPPRGTPRKAGCCPPSWIRDVGAQTSSEDLDPGCTGDAGGVHDLLEARSPAKLSASDSEAKSWVTRTSSASPAAGANGHRTRRTSGAGRPRRAVVDGAPGGVVRTG